MNKLNLMTLYAFVMIAITLPTSSFAVTGTTPTTTSQANGNQNSGQDSQQFTERKAEVLQKISNRIAEGQKVQSCVEASTTAEAMRACRPEHEGKGGSGCSHK